MLSVCYHGFSGKVTTRKPAPVLRFGRLYIKLSCFCIFKELVKNTVYLYSSKLE